MIFLYNYIYIFCDIFPKKSNFLRPNKFARTTEEEANELMGSELEAISETMVVPRYGGFSWFLLYINPLVN